MNFYFNINMLKTLHTRCLAICKAICDAT